MRSNASIRHTRGAWKMTFYQKAYAGEDTKGINSHLKGKGEGVGRGNSLHCYTQVMVSMFI